MDRAWRLRNQGQFKAAEGLCRSMLAREENCGQAWHMLGVLAMDQQCPSEAVRYLKQAIDLEPDQAVHFGNLGVALNALHRFSQAESCLRKALKMAPDFHDARSNLGLALYFQNQFNQAAACFTEILSRVPDHEAALANLGMTRLAQQRYAEAADAYEKAIAGSGDQARWHGNLGAAHIRMGNYDEAAQCYGKAAALAPSALAFEIYESIALRAAGKLPESIRLLQGVIDKDPVRSMAVAHLVTGLEYTCQWDQLELYHPMLHQATRGALDEGRRPDEDPMQNIRRCDDVAVNQAVARAWSHHLQDKARRSGIPPASCTVRPRPAKLTIGYLSYDFRNHPVAHQIFPLFGMHDRDRFRTVAFSLGPDDDSHFRRKIEAGCDEFFDIGALGLSEAFRVIHDCKIDILVDLMGHSHHNRMEILALRPAPIQVSYLGFLSTTGAPFIDYLVADAKVVPKEHEPYFDEKLLRMPHCYQFSHTELISGEPASRRADWGLPADGFVFCCFNTVYKIDRQLFDAWMRILMRVPDSVLWLSGGHQTARQNMRSRARMLGINPDRLIFADKIPLEDHLKRIPLADLALDTIRYNGGATTANALGCGVPVLSVMGRHWVSRMSASQLIATHMPDLVLPSMAAYEDAATELALNADKLEGIQTRLRNNIADCPLFDHKGFVRRLETGFEIIWKRFEDGLGPEHVDIPAIETRDANG